MRSAAQCQRQLRRMLRSSSDGFTRIRIGTYIGIWWTAGSCARVNKRFVQLTRIRNALELRSVILQKRIVARMPTYEYECVNKHRFERFQSMKDEAVKLCPECGTPVHRILHPAGIILKGS